MLLRDLPARWRGKGDPHLSGIGQDSRRVSPGALFLCKAKSPVHARAHAREAWARGAA
ncbi:hypothetical protein IIA16_06090 [bacterium]|nr:hypothetical protein [bacterium]